MQAAELAQAIGQGSPAGADAHIMNLVVPIFAISNISGAQIPALHAFLARLTPTASCALSTRLHNGDSSDGETGASIMPCPCIA